MAKMTFVPGPALSFYSYNDIRTTGPALSFYVYNDIRTTGPALSFYGYNDTRTTGPALSFFFATHTLLYFQQNKFTATGLKRKKSIVMGFVEVQVPLQAYFEATANSQYQSGKLK
jgi:hypothetical protein